MIRAWRAIDRFEGRAALRSWLYRIATNVCLDMLKGRERRARPMDLGPAQSSSSPPGPTLPEVDVARSRSPTRASSPTADDPAELALSRETIKLAFVAALQHLPPQQRAVLILLRGPALEGDRGRRAARDERSRRSTARCSARARRSTRAISRAGAPEPLDEANRELLARYVDAFERYDMESLTSLLHEDATQSMPPYELWLSGRDDILGWWFGTGIGCKGSRLVPTTSRTARPRSVSTSRAGRTARYDAVGAAGARALRRRDRRVHVLPRHRDALPALRSAGPPRAVGRPAPAARRRGP